MVEMTERARRRLEEYLENARRTLAADPRVDADEVLRGLREHVDAELGGRSPAGVVSVDELDLVLERLGPPDALAAEAGLPGRQPAVGDRTALVALGLILAGAILLAAGIAAPAALLAVAAGVAVGRLALAVPQPAPSAEGAARRLVTLAVAATMALATSALLLAPAILVVSQAQIGGLVDALRNPGAPPIPGTRTSAYWTWVAGLAGTTTGLWWTLAGAFAMRRPGAVRRALGPFPFRVEARHGRTLAIIGLALGVAGLIAIVL